MIVAKPAFSKVENEVHYNACVRIRCALTHIQISKSTAVTVQKIHGQRCPASTCPQSQMRSASQMKNTMQCNACVRIRGASLSTLTQIQGSKSSAVKGAQIQSQRYPASTRPQRVRWDVHPCASLNSPWSKNALLYMPTMCKVRGTQVYMSTKSRVRSTKKEPVHKMKLIQNLWANCENSGTSQTQNHCMHALWPVMHICTLHTCTCTWEI